jgi:hypothetical protein
MKNQVSPPVFTIALPVPLARFQVSKTQWMVFALHFGPVRSDVAPSETSKTLFFCFVTSLTASATAELPPATITSTLFTSNHERAIVDPKSALF